MEELFDYIGPRLALVYLSELGCAFLLEGKWFKKKRSMREAEFIQQ